MEPQDIRAMIGNRWTVPQRRYPGITSNLQRYPLNWRFHVAHLNTALSMHPQYALQNFAGFLVDLFPWDPSGGSLVFEVAGFSDTIESPAFQRAIVNMTCLYGLEQEGDYQKLLFEYAHKFINYTHHEELHVYLFDELLDSVKRALKEKKKKLDAEKKRRHELIWSELLEKTWHPDRFQKWCCDIVEQKEFLAMGWNPDDPPFSQTVLATATTATTAPASAAAAGGATVESCA